MAVSVGTSTLWILRFYWCVHCDTKSFNIVYRCDLVSQQKQLQNFIIIFFAQVYLKISDKMQEEWQYPHLVTILLFHQHQLFQGHLFRLTLVQMAVKVERPAFPGAQECEWEQGHFLQATVVKPLLEQLNTTELLVQVARPVEPALLQNILYLHPLRLKLM